MSSQAQEFPLPTAADLQHLRYTAYVDVATYTILIYDYLITFEREKTLMWPMSYKSPIKILFLLTRYMSFFDTTIDIWHHFKENMTIADCNFAYKSMGWAIMAGFIVAEMILCLRTWAVWNRSRFIAIGLSIWFVLTWGSNLVIVGFFLDSLRYAPLPDNLAGCFVIGGNEMIAIDWVLIMVFEAGVLALMLIKAFRNYRIHGHSIVYKTVYRDGSLFYVYLFALSVTNVVIILTLPADLSLILSNFERVIHSLLTARIIMTLRSLGMHSWDEDSRIDTTVHTIELVHRHKGKNTTSTYASTGSGTEFS